MSYSRNHKYIGNEVLVTNARMYLNMLIVPFLISFILQLVLLVVLLSPTYAKLRELNVPGTTAKIPSATIINYFFDVTSWLTDSVSVPPEFQYYLRSKGFEGTSISRRNWNRILDRIYQNRFANFKLSMRKTFNNSLFIYILIPVYWAIVIPRSKIYTKSKFIRGASILDVKEMGKKIADRIKGDRFEHLKIGEISIPREMELKHILILGATGTGKSVLLNQMIAKLINRQEITKDRYIVYDVKGEFLGKHLRSKDIVFYPFDRRCIQWRFFNEIKNYHDFDMISKSLFQPPENDKDVYWYEAAGQVFRSGLIWLWKNKRLKNNDVLNFFNQDLITIRNLFASGLPLEEHGSIKHVHKADSQQAASVISILQSRIDFFRYLSDMDGEFSFRDYVRNSNDTRNIYLLNIKENELIFQPLMTFVVDIMIREVLSLPDQLSHDKGNFSFIIDEFGSLQKLSSIFDFLTIARSKKGSLIVANQDLGSILKIYGKHGKQTFVNNFNTLASFALNDPETAQFISDLFGQVELVKKMDNHQMSPDTIGDRFNIQSQEKIESVILPSELNQLEEFNFFLKMTGIGRTKSVVPKVFFPIQMTCYEQKDNDPDRVLSQMTYPLQALNSRIKEEVLNDIELKEFMNKSPEEDLESSEVPIIK